MVVTRSNGQQVVLVLHAVDRLLSLVSIDIPAYNSRFTFSKATGKVALISGGRQVIDGSKPAITHVSGSVYAGLMKWTSSILKSKR